MAQCDVVVLAAGEILQRGAIALGGQGAQIYLQVFVAVLDAGFVGAFAEHFLHLGMRDECFERIRRAGSGDQEIEIADGFASAAQAAGGSDFFDVDGAEIIRQLIGDALREAQQESARALAVAGDGAQDFFLELRAHARKLAEFLFAAQALQIVDGGAAVSFKQQADAFGAESLDLQKLQRAGGISFQHLIAALETAALFDLGENRSDAFADAGNVGDFARGVLENGGNLLGVRFDDTSGVAVGANAERILIRDLHQVRRFKQQPCDGAIFHGLTRL